MPRGVRRFFYMLGAGALKPQGPTNADTYKFFKNFKGALYYQLAQGDSYDASNGHGFDSSLYESDEQRLGCEWDATGDRDGCAAGVPTVNRPRPAYCFLVGEATADNCKGDNRPSRLHPTVAAAASKSKLKLVYARPDTTGTAVTLARVTTQLPLPTLDPSSSYSFKIKYELCYREPGESGLTNCGEARSCQARGCGYGTSSSAQTFNIPAGSSFTSVVGTSVDRFLMAPELLRYECQDEDRVNWVITPITSLMKNNDATLLKSWDVDGDGEEYESLYSAEDAGSPIRGIPVSGNVPPSSCS